MSTQTTLGSTFAGELITPDRRALRRGPQPLQRRDRQAPGADRPLRQHRRRAGRARPRARAEPRRRRPRRRPLDRRLLVLRRRDRHRRRPDEGRRDRPRARTARFGAGLNWGELDAATQEHGLAVTGGRVTHTGVAGLHARQRLRLARAQVRPDLREPDLGRGRDRRRPASCAPSADENPDLLWGLKGGGGNFGVVTEFEFHLHPVGPIVFAGMILHPRSAAPELAALLPRLHGAGARRGRRRARVHHGAAGGLRPRGAARQAGRAA